MPNPTAKTRMLLDEKRHVENSLLDQLQGLDWDVLRLEQTSPPSASQRATFAEVVIRPELEAALRSINPFLDDAQVGEVADRVAHLPQGSLLEANRHVFDLLHDNTTVAVSHQTGEVSPTVRYVDYERPDRNRWLAVSQFKVAIPGTDRHIVPDVILFLNGLPLVVIECKSPRAEEPIASAIDQMLRYSQQRGTEPEGNAALFAYNQFVVATCRQIAKFGTISTHIEKHFYRWLDPFPRSLDDLAHGGTAPNDQQRLVAGMCAPANLLSLLQSFTLFPTDDRGRTIKVVGRYQQFRAVKKAVARLQAGQNRAERGGIIWHTQGSGKSLTMMFLVREMRSRNAFADWKVVFLNDRAQLEEQLTDTSKALGATVKVADSIAKLKALLSGPAPDLVMAMMHKFQERDLSEIFPVLNTSPRVLLLVDEAHRSQYSLLGANLDRALPNAARIAYTGTPIERTETTFGDYIDKYTMRQSITDGTTLEIIYEGRTHNAEIADTEGVDTRFADVFSEYNLAERLQILGYGTREAYLEAQDTIRAKAEDIVSHYLTHVFPNGYKGQVVATSREAAARYKEHLDAAIQSKIAELEVDNPLQLPLDRLRRLETAVVVSGGSHNDPPHLKAYADAAYQKRSIRRFKMPFDATDGSGQDAVRGDVGLIVVNNMLLTGFDAPIEQVLYLDRVMRDQNLLQTIARVNRIGDENKEKGFIVDYVGVGHHLKAALDRYDAKEQAEILAAIGDDGQLIADLVQAHREVWDVLRAQGLTDFSDPDAFYDLFYDEDARFAYLLAFRKLTHAFNLVLPRKEALDYLDDYQNFVMVGELASRHLHDSRLSMKGIPPKLRAVTDAFLVSRGITQKVEPISILDDNFLKEVETHPRPQTKAAAVEHAIRHHIQISQDEDPELFASFATEMQRILAEFKDNWERIYKELEKLRQKLLARETEPNYGLDRKRQLPLYRIFRAELFAIPPTGVVAGTDVAGIVLPAPASPALGKDTVRETPAGYIAPASPASSSAMGEEDIARLVSLTQNAADLLARETHSVGFWNSIPAQNRLKQELQDLFLSPDFHTLSGIFARRQALVSRLMEWARANQGLLQRTPAP